MIALVTGGDGFIGRVLCAELAQRGFTVRAALRAPDRVASEATETFIVGDIDGHTEWGAALENVDLVFHLAAMAHMPSPSKNDQAAIFRTNVAATAALARAARFASRFVYVSTAKVHGETSGSRPFCESDAPAPQGAYAISKWEAEQAIRADSGSFTIVRAPLVYGRGVRANFLALLKAIDRQLPLPFGAVENRRSLVFAENLADALMAAARCEAAQNETFLVSDGEDVSTAELIRELGRALGRPTRSWPVPYGMLRVAARIAGRSAALEKLTANLQIDSSKLRATTGWTPPFTLHEGLADTGAWYCESRSRI